MKSSNRHFDGGGSLNLLWTGGKPDGIGDVDGIPPGISRKDGSFPYEAHKIHKIKIRWPRGPRSWGVVMKMSSPLEGWRELAFCTCTYCAAAVPNNLSSAYLP